MSSSRYRFPTPAAATVMSALFVTAPAVAAAGFEALGDSLASPFVQSRAMVQILRADDPLDRICYERRFVDAWVVPTSQRTSLDGTVEHRKWQEQWTLARCGTPIGYRVFFTEVGQGGVYFSVLKNDHIERPASLRRPPRLADSVPMPSRLEDPHRDVTPAK